MIQISKMLSTFYCLKIYEAILLLLLATFAFGVVKEKLEVHRYWWWDVAGLLVVFLAVILYTTLANRSGDHMQEPKLIPFHTYRDVMNGANPELYRSNFMNAALFYPAGLLLTSLLPEKWPGWCRCLLTAVLFGAMSGAIEYVQYHYALGNVEIDDVIHNTGGALAGSLAMLVLTPMINRIAKNVAAWLKNE